MSKINSMLRQFKINLPIIVRNLIQAFFLKKKILSEIKSNFCSNTIKISVSMLRDAKVPPLQLAIWPWWKRDWWSTISDDMQSHVHEQWQASMSNDRPTTQLYESMKQIGTSTCTWELFRPLLPPYHTILNSHGYLPFVRIQKNNMIDIWLLIKLNKKKKTTWMS